MLTAERRQFILDMLKRDGKVVARQLSEELHLSEDTIRRDLRDLADEGLLQRVHGGALPCAPATPIFKVRQEQIFPAKLAIAQAAARIIRDGQVVILDGGSTNVQVARYLARDLHATIITNSPPLTAALEEHPYVEVVLLGGHLYKHSLVTVGPPVLEALHMIRADLYMPGICSIHPEVGMSAENLEEAYVQRAMIACSAEVIALVSPEKLNKAYPYIITPLSELSEIITERGVPDEVLEPYRSLGLTITRA
jgi:DeoR/GlpR family transcriptional regulator of sugar metabolism